MSRMDGTLNIRMDNVDEAASWCLASPEPHLIASSQSFTIVYFRFDMFSPGKNRGVTANTVHPKSNCQIISPGCPEITEITVWGFVNSPGVDAR